MLTLKSYMKKFVINKTSVVVGISLYNPIYLYFKSHIVYATTCLYSSSEYLSLSNDNKLQTWNNVNSQRKCDV